MKLVKTFLFSVFLVTFSINVFAVTISEIQGSGASSPLEGQTITTEGNIVTFVTANGFFIQSPADLEDGNIETSEGVYVYGGSNVAVGDIVNITATVAEYYYLTELKDAEVTVVSSGNPLPEPVLLGESVPSKTPTGDIPEMERYEGMLVTFQNGYVTGPTDNYQAFYVNPYGTRTFNEPGIEYPGVENLPVWDSNPDVLQVSLRDTEFSNVSFFSGAIINELEGPLTYSYGAYKIIPYEMTYENSTLPRPVREPNENEITIATQNMLRLSMSESDTKFSKLSLQVRENLQAPDILAVQEVFDIDTLQKLADKIHSDDNSLNYTPYLIEGNSSDIDNGFLIKDTVTVNNVYQIFKEETISTDYGTYPLHDRPPLVLECSVTKGEKTIDLTVICVHNRSLNDIDIKDFVRKKRFRQAEDIAEFVNSILEENPNANIVVTGDFNGYQFTDGYVDVLGIITGNLDPQGAMVEGVDLIEMDLRNQIYSLPFEERYSYVHNGNSSAIDHMLTSFNLNKYVTGISYARANADCPESYEDADGTSLRCSDHDGLVMFLKLEPESGTKTALPLAELMANGFAETTYCNSYLVNTSGDDLTFTLTDIDSDNNIISSETHYLSKGEKVLLTSLVGNEDYANLTIETENNATLFSETVTETGQMTAYIYQDSANTRFIPHIAEKTDYWDSFVFLSSPEMADTTLDVAVNATVFRDNYAFFDNCEQYLDNSSGSVNSATAYGTLNSVSNQISGFEIFKKVGNDGAATELIVEGSETLYIPHIATDTETFWTGFSFLNPTDTAINSTVTLYDANGEVSYTYSFTTSPHTKLVNVIEGMFPDIDTNSQWGIIKSDGKLIGLELYGTYSAGICGFSLGANALSDGVIPFIYKGEGLWSGVAFANPDIETAKVFVRLTGKDGSLKEEKSFEIDAKKRIAFVVGNAFSSDLIESTDIITFYSEKPVVAIVASGDLDRTFMTALAANPYKF